MTMASFDMIHKQHKQYRYVVNYVFSFAYLYKKQ